jgi:putative transposase
MDTQKITKQYRLSQWAKVIQARQDSGQTIKDFCQVTGISKNQYFYWQRKLRDMACTEIALKEEVLDTAPDGWLQLAPAQPQRVETLSKFEGTNLPSHKGTGYHPNFVETC